MNIAAVKKFCASLPGARAEIKWQVDSVYSIGAKMFAVAFVGREGRGLVSFKAEDERFLELTDRDGIVPAPYLARAKWVQVSDLGNVSDAELKALLRRSYELVLAKLPKRMRMEIFGQ